MLRRKLSRVQYGIVLLVLSTFVLGLVAVVGDSISTYLTFTIGGQQPSQLYRDWTASDPLPTPNTISNYTLIPIALNTTAYDFNVSNASYVYYIKVYNGSTVTNYVVLHWDQWDFVNNTVITDVLIPSFYDSNGTAITPGYISVSSATVPGVGINNGQVFIKKSKWNGYVNDYRYYITVTAYDIYTVYPKTTNTSTNYPTLNLGFIVNVILAFTGIYLLLKGIYYMGGVRL